MKYERKEEDAVSPVIGVILMVAITVILAAVIAAFVFGMAGNIVKPRNVGATVRQIGMNVVVTWQGGPDNSEVSNATILVTPSNGPQFATEMPGNLVGNTTTLMNVASGGADHIVVAANFIDGGSQVILDTMV